MFKKIAFPIALLILSLSGPLPEAYAQVAPAATANPVPVFQIWMHPDLPTAWNQGFRGQGVTLTVVDSFYGDPGGPDTETSHGALVSSVARRVAPWATMALQEGYPDMPVILARNRLNVINASFESITPNLSIQDQSIVDAARRGQAVVVASAGNANTTIKKGDPFFGPSRFHLSMIGAQSVIYAGALERNGAAKPGSLAKKAWYSNTPGVEAIASQFVMVGVDEKMLDAGTSFAAPIVAGYAAIVGSKFKTAKPIQVTWQILNTARTDTIQDNNRNIHGRGEASLSRALAPVAIK